MPRTVNGTGHDAFGAGGAEQAMAFLKETGTAAAERIADYEPCSLRKAKRPRDERDSARDGDAGPKRRAPVHDSARDQAGWIGAYSPAARKRRIARFHGKRARRVWTKRIVHQSNKDFASTRLRVKGRFVKKEEEDLLQDLVGIV